MFKLLECGKEIQHGKGKLNALSTKAVSCVREMQARMTCRKLIALYKRVVVNENSLSGVQTEGCKCALQFTCEYFVVLYSLCGP
jgi:hypothetical protein